MKTISRKEILQAIIKEALTIKRKKEIYEIAQKMNSELKQLNEDRWQGLGHGFANYEGPSPIIGMATSSNYEEAKPEDEECKCTLDQFPKLEKDIENFNGDEKSEIENDQDSIESLKNRNAELEAKLAEIQNSINR